MAYFLFIDESGHDRKASPYEVLAGVAVKDSALWTIVQAMHASELRFFGRRYTLGEQSELKGTNILKSKVYHHARLNVSVPPEQAASLAKFALDDGANAGVQHLKALALAKLAYTDDVFDICFRHHCKAFASIIETNAEGTSTGGLRKDYAYLFERFFYYLEDQGRDEQGIIVFDELDKTKSHLLIDQVHKYFKETAIGRHRALQVVPEPFFVHSDLTTGVQIADLVAYIVSWGFRIPSMSKPGREELAHLAGRVGKMRYLTARNREGNPNYQIWSFAHIRDLRTRLERDFAE